MGNFINLHIIPGRINRKDWLAVFRQSLDLVAASPLLACAKNNDGLMYIELTENTKNSINGDTGWCSVGGIHNDTIAEPYQLIEDIYYYQQWKPQQDNGYDILLDGLHSLEIDHPQCSVNIWGNKTQDEATHIYLLAIACLICDHFPDAALVDGTISAGQCYQAIQWANQFLPKSIGMPVTTDMDRLLLRLRATELTEMQCLEAFFELVLGVKDGDMGDCLKKHFSPKTISEYYRKKLKPLRRVEGQLVLNGEALKEYLSMELDFHELYQLIMVDPQGNHLASEEFRGELLIRKLPTQELKTVDDWEQLLDKTYKR